MPRPVTATFAVLLLAGLGACGSGTPVATDATDGPTRGAEASSPPASRSVTPSTTGDSAAPPISGPARVRLWHCGVTLVGYPDGMWEMRQPPFDATNAPASFTGHGTASVPRTDRLVYVDAGGQRLVFVPGRQVPPVLCN